MTDQVRWVKIIRDILAIIGLATVLHFLSPVGLDRAFDRAYHGDGGRY